MTGTTPELARQGALAILTLRRPDQHNRMQPEDIAALHGHLAAVSAESALRAVVLTATGPSFASGYDIGAFGREAAAGHDFSQLCDALEALPQPVVCALNGPVYGGSIDLALACDFRISHPGFVMAVPAARLGIHYYGSGQMRYVSRLGLGAAKRLLLAAETFDADHALRIGFLDRIVAESAVMAEAMALAARLAANAPRAVRAMKRSLNEIAAGKGDVAAMNARFSESLAADELAEGLAAWRERRSPRFPDPEAFSSEADTGSHQENATKKKS